jgi:hypothetical protein
MPIINNIDYELPLVVLSGYGDVQADAGVLQYFQITIAGVSDLSAIGTFLTIVGGSVDVGGSSTLFALGRIGDEPNVFGVVDVGGTSGLTIDPLLGVRGKAVLTGVAELFPSPSIAEAERSEFNIFLTIADLPGVGFAAVYSARITAGGVGYPIRNFSFTEGTADAGSQLNVTLQKPSDRAAILAADEFSFEIYDNGTWKTLFESGRRTAAAFSFGWSEGRPADALTVSTAAEISAKLEKSPRRNLTIYDPLREDIDADDFEKILDENGVQYSHELKTISGMKLHQLLNYVFVTRCGFASVETNLPNDPIRRLDVGITDTFNDAIAGVIGIFRPLMFVAADVLYILDSTIALPTGFASPVALPASQYKNAQLQITEQAADGFVVSYVDSERDYDYFDDREVDLPDSVFGTAGSSDYTETAVTYTYRDFYKYSTPATPIRTERVGVTTTVRGILDGDLQQITQTVETIEFDGKLRLASIDKRRTAAIPDLSGTFPIVTREIRRETTRFEYKPDIKNPRREVLAKTSKRVTGLVMTDTENTHMDLPFRQEFYNAWRSGNFTGNGQTVETETIETDIETLEQNNRGQNEMRRIIVDYMTTPPNVHGDVTDARGGDATTNAQTSATKEVIVYRTGLTDRTDAKLIGMAGGEFKIANLKALAKRRLDKRQVRTGSIELKGLNLSFGRGTVLTLVDRDGNAAGSYVVEGRSIAGQNLGLREQLTSQILSVAEIATNGPGLTIGTAAAGGILLNAGGTAAFTLSINCESGYELAADSDNADVRVWAKANAGDAFQNIHSSPIDLTPYAGTARTFYFELRIDAGADDGNEIVAIVVRRG